MRICLVLVLLAACDPDGGGKVVSAGDSGGDSGAGGDSGDSGDSGTVDRDGDGADALVDCDDTDASVHPGAVEVCDGRDQDCDGVADDGVPNDGAGCRDPGMPARPDPATSVEITLATADEAYAGTDDGYTACVGDGLCFGLDVGDWDDREAGQVDVHHEDGLSIALGELDRFSISTSSGGNRWEPSGFMVSVDGFPTYCRTFDGVYFGSEGSELPSWTDPDGLGMHCDTVWASPLTHGPMVGAVDEDGARIWLRTDATRAVAIRVARSAGELADATPVHYAYPRAAADFTSEVRIGGLGAGQTWAFDVEIDGERFGPWSLTTAPEVGSAGRWRVGIGSCTKDDDQPAFAAVLAYDPDLYLFVGDNHYGNTDDLGGLRQWYRWAHSRTWRDDLLSRASILATWDDHDYVGNNTDGTEPGKDNAVRAFDEYWANAGLGLADVTGVFHQEQWGDVDLFFLDDRYYRGLEDSIVGDAQEAWLLAAVEASTATFKVVVSGSAYSRFGSDDSWAAFPEARTRTLTALATVPGVLLVSGDVHRSEFRSHADIPGYALPELVASGMAYPTVSGCDGDSDVVACWDGGQSWVTVDVDTTAADPTLVAKIVDVDGTAHATWTITRSMLEPS